MGNEDAGTLINKGNDFYKTKNYEEAIKCYEKAELLEPSRASTLDRNKAMAFHDWGNVLYILAGNRKDKEYSFNSAFEKYDNAARLYKTDTDKAFVFYDWGNALYILAKNNDDESLFKEAFDKYDKVTHGSDSNSDLVADAFANWGDALYYLAKTKKDNVLFREAINKYKKAVKEDEPASLVVSWGDALYDLAKIEQNKNLFEEAFEKYDKITQINDDYSYAFIKQGIVLTYLAEIKQDENLYEKATKSFIDARKSILNIFVHLDEKDEELIIKTKVLYPLLNTDTEDGNFFNETIKNISQELDKYKEIYIRSIFIISRLRINREYEKSVAHYTKKTIAQKLLFKESRFRLNAIGNSNDTTEGKTLLDYLFKNKPSEEKKSDTEYRAFAGCFTFQHDSLNQFRLYGKDQNQEGTGLSLIFHENFFSKESKMATEKREIKPEELSIEDIIDDKDEYKKYTLFRCIYIDPKEQQVETLGQKEITKKKQKKYKKYIDDVFDIVNERMEKLRDLISQNSNLDRNVIEQLLINLRYLTKHIAFKEEQECRIIRICNINEGKIDFDDEKMYIKYEPDILYEPDVSYKPKVISRIEKVYFGPKATNIETFQDRLKINKLDGKIDCEKSTNPLA
ncbi:MAG: tetratricopeptide repeat protein [Fibromonadaceae bacterium]|jgi:tetratricopeptide (TPR) repeat protein|nr:tetratricopeptide repeat protein [Fibromonadaceae bacterium]